jgi:hypothetical protein
MVSGCFGLGPISLTLRENRQPDPTESLTVTTAPQYTAAHTTPAPELGNSGSACGAGGPASRQIGLLQPGPRDVAHNHHHIFHPTAERMTEAIAEFGVPLVECVPVGPRTL